MSRERETVATSLRAQRSNPCFSTRGKMDCFAALAMTWRGRGLGLVGCAKERKRRAHHPSTSSRKMVGSLRSAHPTQRRSAQPALHATHHTTHSPHLLPTSWSHSRHTSSHRRRNSNLSTPT